MCFVTTVTHTFTGWCEYIHWAKWTAFWLTFCEHGVYDISSAHVVLEKVAHRLKFHSFFTKSQAIQPILTMIIIIIIIIKNNL